MSSDIGNWLARIGLERFSALLEQNEVSQADLQYLNEDDLRELGLPMGPRKRILKAIDPLQTEPAAAEAIVKQDRKGDHLPAERRQLTVMFIDMVNSTSLAAQLDPEEMSDVIAQFYATITSVIEEYGGHIVNFLGDGVLAIFGWPTVREDEVAVALRAGLQLLRASEKLTTPDGTATAVRIGCDCGWVVIGKPNSDETQQGRSFIGNAINLAARLQTVAKPGQMIVSRSTWQLVGDYFKVEDLPPLTLKGFEEPVEAVRVIRANQIETRFEFQKRKTGRGTMIGRDAELSRLLACWSEVCAGFGRGAVVVGEAGIGKSRICSEMMEHLSNDDYYRLQFQCSPYFSDVPYWPVIQQISTAAGLIRATAADTEKTDMELANLERLKALLDHGENSEKSVSAIADLVGVDVPKDDAMVSAQASKRRTQSQEALISHAIRLSREKPVLMVLEDAQWMDPSSLELFNRAFAVTEAERIMILITSRFGEEPNFISPNLTRIVMDGLNKDAIAAMVHDILGDFAAPSSVVNAIVERTDGVPLFIEELTKAVIDRNEHAVAKEEPLPASLHDSLMTRLDRLSTLARELAQLAACIGRDFDRDLLLRISKLNADQIDAPLLELIESEVILHRRAAKRTGYMFKHALVRDAANSTLLKSRRRLVHADIVAALEARQDTDPTLIGWHAAEAGDAPRAFSAFLEAGSIAARRSANVEAENILNRARNLIVELPQQDRAEASLEVLEALSVPMIATHGYASPAVEDALSEALAIAGQRKDDVRRFKITRGLWNFFYDQGSLARSDQLAESLIELAAGSGRGDWLRLVHRARGSNRMSEGYFADARASLEKVLTESESWSRDATLFEHGEDPESIARLYLAWIAVIQGDVDDGLADVKTALEQSVHLALPIAGSFARSINNNMLYLTQDPSGALENASIGLAIAEERGFPFFAAQHRIFIGWANVHLGRGAQALDLIKEGISGWRATGAGLHVCTWNALLADAALHLGDIREASLAIDEALDIANRTGEKMMHSDNLRLHSLRLFAEGHEADGEAALHEALTLARQRGAGLFQLNAALELVRLDMRRGSDAGAALAHLAEAYRAQKQGHWTKAMRESASLLERQLTKGVSSST